MINTYQLDKIVEQENFSVFPDSPMQCLYYLSGFPSEFLSLGVEFPTLILEVIEAKFSSYLTCKLKLLARKKNGEIGLLYFFSIYNESNIPNPHEVDIFWSEKNVDS